MKHIKRVISMLLPQFNQFMQICGNNDREAQRRYRSMEAVNTKERPPNHNFLYMMLDYIANAMLYLAKKVYDKDLYCGLIRLLTTEGMNSYFNVIYFLHFDCPNQDEKVIQRMIKYLLEDLLMSSDVFDEVISLVNATQLTSAHYKKATLYFEHSLIPLFAAYCRKSQDFSFITKAHLHFLCSHITTSISLSQQIILFLSLYTSHKGPAVITNYYSKGGLQTMADRNSFLMPHLLLLLAKLMEPTEASFQYFCDQFLHSLRYSSATPICLKAISMFLQLIPEDDMKTRINRLMEERITARRRIIDYPPLLLILSNNPTFFSSTITKLTRCEEEVLTAKWLSHRFITFCELDLPFSRRNNDFFVCIFKEYLMAASSLLVVLLRRHYAQTLKYIATKPVTIDGDKLFDFVDKYNAYQKKRQETHKSVAIEKSPEFLSMLSRFVLLDVIVMVLENGIQKLRIQNWERILTFLQDFVPSINQKIVFVVLNKFLHCLSQPLLSSLVIPDLTNDSMQNQIARLLLTALANNMQQKDNLWRYVHIVNSLLQKCSAVEEATARQLIEITKKIAAEYLHAERVRRSNQFNPLHQPESCKPEVPYVCSFPVRVAYPSEACWATTRYPPTLALNSATHCSRYWLCRR